MAGTFALQIVSPEGNVLKEDAEFVVLPGGAGELGILPNHAPLIAGLKVGVLRFSKDNQVRRVALSGGFAEVADNTVTVLADTAELAEDIDVDRALAAKQRAERRLENTSGDIDIRRAELALKRANARLHAAEGQK
jgi:F-type H+-transporting ATPase subunit epsilon